MPQSYVSGTKINVHRALEKGQGGEGAETHANTHTPIFMAISLQVKWIEIKLKSHQYGINIERIGIFIITYTHIRSLSLPIDHTLYKTVYLERHIYILYVYTT